MFKILSIATFNIEDVFCEKENGVMVPPFDHPQIIEGQATVGAEMLEQIKSDGTETKNRNHERNAI